MTASPLVPVPIPDRVAAMIGACMPIHVLQAEVDAECAAREVHRLRGPLSGESRAAREHALSALASANKVLAAYNPGLTVRPRRSGSAPYGV
ncbi:hypothetical protein [Streptomyces sp. MUM 178J]|uniref:hypothetical protein n=1 Tax=Streptomyces sp. MUM 178J TaxID=2791991 RepID=UPI001F04760D|nr:hypothetical protein [Streptomyces sp. MUM 178J]WRQ80070.1 hypothetical protein I3F59_012310 [Streptomyces sp. MUM 178J]